MFFPGSESRFQKNTPVPSFITGFHCTWIVYYNTGLLVPCFGFETIRENIDYWVPVALRVKWILIGRFQPISGRVTKRASHVLKTKVDVSRFVALTWVSLKLILNCLRLNQRCHPRENKKLLILIRLSQLCLRSLTRIAQVNPFQRPRIPRPKIIPSQTRRLLKSHARQILVSLAKKSQCWSGRSPKIEECMNWKNKWSKLLSLPTEFEADHTFFYLCWVLSVLTVFFLNLCQTSSTEAFIVVFLNFSFLFWAHSVSASGVRL